MIRQRLLCDQHRLSEREEKNFHILELLRQRGPMTRTELAQGTGYNIVTVSNYMTQFLKQGLVSERGFDISTGGRKPVLVELNTKAGFVIGIDVGAMGFDTVRTIMVITDLRGEIVHRVVKHRPLDNMDRLLNGLRPLIHELCDSSPIDVKKIRGIGIGLPGIMDERAGTVRDICHHGIRVSYVAIRDQLEADFGLPVLMGNDATLAGYGELRLGMDHPVENLIYLYADMGASLIFNGHVYWGSGGSAGELGIFISSEEDGLTWSGQASPLMRSRWDLGLTSQAKKLVQEGHPTLIHELARGDAEAVTLGTVLEAAEGHDPLARELIEHSAIQLGIRIAYLVNFLNPEAVIIGGGIEKAGPLIFDPIWRCIKRYSYEEPASLVDILPAQLGENASALGASCWVIREVFIQA